MTESDVKNELEKKKKILRRDIFLENQTRPGSDQLRFC